MNYTKDDLLKLALHTLKAVQREKYTFVQEAVNRTVDILRKHGVKEHDFMEYKK